MAQYEPTVIHTFADRLYRQASQIEATYVLLGLLVGGGAGFAVASAARAQLMAVFVIVVIGVALVGAVGYSIGQQKAFSLKLQAQQALCQLQI